MGRTGFAPGPLGLGLGRALGEGGGLPSGLALGLVEVGPGLVELASEAFVLLAEAFVLPPELLDLGAELLQLLQDTEGHGHRGEYLDGRHRCLSRLHIRFNHYCASPRRKRQGTLIKSRDRERGVCRRTQKPAGILRSVHPRYRRPARPRYRTGGSPPPSRRGG